MNHSQPHYLLFSDPGGEDDPGRWHFVLRSIDGASRFEAGDVEPHARGDRLELLTLVRGLEALDQPSRVTVVTSSTYVREGIRRGLSEWRNNGWRWECFGTMVPVKHLDLWQRVDRAMRIHEVDCRTYRLDLPHTADITPGENVDARPGHGPGSNPETPLRTEGSTIAGRLRRWLAGR